MAELGVHGALPFLLYVGKGSGPGGLRARLRRHAEVPWFEIADLLACQARTLPLWWGYADKVHPRRVPPMTPLARVAFDQALAWQHRRIVWGWEGVSGSLVGAHESALIADNMTLLNRRGRGYAQYGPAQLRAIGPYARQRAWWLFHASWIAVLDQRPDGWAHRTLRSTRVACDEAGWPTPLSEGRQQVVKVPSERAARRVLAECAPPHLRDAASVRSEANEARAWWAAYAGHQFTAEPESVEAALRAALRTDAQGRRGPATLPDPARQAQLAKLIARLPGIAH